MISVDSSSSLHTIFFRTSIVQHFTDKYKYIDFIVYKKDIDFIVIVQKEV